MHRSHSSIAKHSSLSSEGLDCTIDVPRVLRRLSSLPADFCCSICMNVFKKPCMLTCGHSFCAECIRHWLTENVSCPTCRTDTQVPIRNIALEQLVDEFRIGQENRVRFSKQLRALEEDGSNGYASILKRQTLRANRRRVRVSVVGPGRVVDGPGSSMEALPTSSRQNSYRSLSSLPKVEFEASGDDLDSSAGLALTPRQSLLPNENRYWNEDGDRCSTCCSEASDVAHINSFKRTSLLRRSICAIRKSVTRRKRRAANVTAASDHVSYMDDSNRAPNSAEPVTDHEFVAGSSREDTLKTKKFKWKRFFPFKLRKVHPTRCDDRSEQPCGQLCVYSGFGRTFERIHPGEEIAVVVFGKRGVGKTSLLDVATLSCEGRHGIAPLGLTERMRLGGKSNHSEYRFAHMTSITVQARHQLFVIDLIDAEFEDDHSVAHTSYMHAADAAILLYSCSDSASLLTAMSIHRQLAAISESRKPCALIANVIDGISQRFVSREMGEKTARNIRATYYETNLLLQDGTVFKAIEHLCRTVVAKRKNTDVKDICAVM